MSGRNCFLELQQRRRSLEAFLVQGLPDAQVPRTAMNVQDAVEDLACLVLATVENKRLTVARQRGRVEVT
jgi:hypothetical protein